MPKKDPTKPARSRRTPPKLRVAGSNSLQALEFKGTIDVAADPRSRPLVGRDIVEWRRANRLERLQVVQMLAMATPQAYITATKEEAENTPLPFDMELLLRYYMRHQIRTTQRRPVDVFYKVYGEHLKAFEGTPHYEPARVALYARFGAMLGRTVFSVYRWFKAQSMGSSGRTSATLRRLLDQLPDDSKGMRDELEDLARTAFKVRGYDFDTMFPLPTPDNPPIHRKPGRKRKSAPQSEAVIEALAAQPEPKEARTKDTTSKKIAPKKVARKSATKKSNTR